MSCEDDVAGAFERPETGGLHPDGITAGYQRRKHKVAVAFRLAGAFLAGYFITPLLGVGTINDAITIPTLLVTLLGSVVLLAIYKAVARRA